MLPQIDIIYNFEYAKRLQRIEEEPFADTWQKIIRIGGDFEKIFAEGETVILELIAKYSGFDWQEHAEAFIPIYLSAAPPSFPQPLTLAINEDGAEMLGDCIAQLAYRNMAFGFLDDTQRSDCIQSVTEHVLAELAGESVDDSPFDLQSTSIKKILKK